MDHTAAITEAFTNHLARVATTPIPSVDVAYTDLTDLLVRRDMIAHLVLRCPEAELPTLNRERDNISAELRRRLG